MPEYIETRPEAIAAIHKSISHWNDICCGCEDSYYSGSCSLCLEFGFSNCFPCPLFKVSGRCTNDGSPWNAYWMAHKGEDDFCNLNSAAEAEAMLEALVSLLPESEREIYGGK